MYDYKTKSKSVSSTFRLILTAVIGGLLAAVASVGAGAVEMSPAAKAVVDYDKSGAVPKTKYRIAYLTECVDNPYCLARLAGLKAAAAKYGFEFKIFDANFSPATQAKVVENAVTEGFDGYLFGPAAAQPGCGLYNRLLKPTVKLRQLRILRHQFPQRRSLFRRQFTQQQRRQFCFQQCALVLRKIGIHTDLRWIKPAVTNPSKS